MLINYVVI